MEFRFGPLVISSKFDSGNLARAEQVDVINSELGQRVDYEFNVWTSPDCANTPHENGNSTWFHFSIRGTPLGKVVKLNIMNMNKQGKLYSQGMSPVFKTVPAKNTKWQRIREKAAYDFNNGAFKLTFSHRFQESTSGTTYFAFCYPYSYDEFQKELNCLEIQYGSAADQNMSGSGQVYFYRELLCYSNDKLRVDLITLSSLRGIQSERELRLVGLFPDEKRPRAHQFSGKKVIFVSSRVHPGETPSSFVFNGFLKFLLRADDARAIALRDMFVFLLIPMLNPDGVRRGHYRTDSRGVNLNRVYTSPDSTLHPSIYAAKLLMLYHFSCRRIHDLACTCDEVRTAPSSSSLQSEDSQLEQVRLPLLKNNFNDGTSSGTKVFPVLRRSKTMPSLLRECRELHGADEKMSGVGLHAPSNRRFSNADIALPRILNTLFDGVRNDQFLLTCDIPVNSQPSFGIPSIDACKVGLPLIDHCTNTDSTHAPPEQGTCFDDDRLAQVCQAREAYGSQSVSNSNNAGDSSAGVLLRPCSSNTDRSQGAEAIIACSKATPLAAVTNLTPGSPVPVTWEILDGARSLESKVILDKMKNNLSCVCQLQQRTSSIDGFFSVSAGAAESPVEVGLACYVDLHGHASKQGCFMYGNHFENESDHVQCMLLPKLISINSGHFDFSACNFSLRNMCSRDKRDGMSKEGSGRVAMFKAMGLIQCYTLECNYNSGRCSNTVPQATRDGGRATPPPPPAFPPRYTPEHWEEVGRALAVSILDCVDRNPWSRLPTSEYKSKSGVMNSLSKFLRMARHASSRRMIKATDGVGCSSNLPCDVVGSIEPELKTFSISDQLLLNPSASRPQGRKAAKSCTTSYPSRLHDAVAFSAADNFARVAVGSSQAATRAASVNPGVKRLAAFKLPVACPHLLARTSSRVVVKGASCTRTEETAVTGCSNAVNTRDLEISTTGMPVACVGDSRAIGDVPSSAYPSVYSYTKRNYSAEIQNPIVLLQSMCPSERLVLTSSDKVAKEYLNNARSPYVLHGADASPTWCQKESGRVGAMGAADADVAGAVQKKRRVRARSRKSNAGVRKHVRHPVEVNSPKKNAEAIVQPRCGKELVAKDIARKERASVKATSKLPINRLSTCSRRGMRSYPLPAASAASDLEMFGQRDDRIHIDCNLETGHHLIHEVLHVVIGDENSA